MKKKYMKRPLNALKMEEVIIYLYVNLCIIFTLSFISAGLPLYVKTDDMENQRESK